MAQEKNYLETNGFVFAKTFAQTLADMVGASYTPDTVAEVKQQLVHEPGMIVSIHFSGIIQGEYILILHEETAARMVGCWKDDTTQQWKTKRPDYVDFMKEALNGAAGTAIQDLEKEFEGLTILPPVAIFGQIAYPTVPACIVKITGENGPIQCCFMLNMMNLGVGEKLEQAIADIQRTASELNESKRNVASMLDVFPAGLVAIDESGVVLPGHSKRTATTIGLPTGEKIVSRQITELLGLPPDTSLQRDLSLWLEAVYFKYGEVEFRILDELFPLNEFSNVRGLTLKIKCIPIETEQAGKLDRLLMVIEDVTQQRRLETEMKRINKLHDQNIELLSQVVNLEPDEITQFVFDSSELISRAENLLHNHKRDIEFVNTLYRTIHTLKGTSGQFKFKQLQDMAHTIESQLSKLRDRTEVDDSSFDEIAQAIKEVNSYITRIDDLRQKLGSQKESVKAKAERNQPTMMVQLAVINELAADADRMLATANKLEKDPYFIKCIENLGRKTKRLRQLRISFFQGTLSSLATTTSGRVGKKVAIKLDGDIMLDIEIIRKLHEALIHLINNAVDHGIEPSQKRIAAGKLDTGLIVIKSSITKDGARIEIRDDGAGISTDLIRAKVVEKKLVEPDTAALLSDKEVLSFIFVPGFSTKDAVSEISGRGVGMDVVNTFVKEYKGSVEVETSLGKGTSISLLLPVGKAASEINEGAV
jgi:two-component system chemotaxis sensor kinase CheA